MTSPIDTAREHLKKVELSSYRLVAGSIEPLVPDPQGIALGFLGAHDPDIGAQLAAEASDSGGRDAQPFELPVEVGEHRIACRASDDLQIDIGVLHVRDRLVRGLVTVHPRDAEWEDVGEGQVTACRLPSLPEQSAADPTDPRSRTRLLVDLERGPAILQFSGGVLLIVFAGDEDRRPYVALAVEQLNWEKQPPEQVSNRPDVTPLLERCVSPLHREYAEELASFPSTISGLRALGALRRLEGESPAGQGALTAVVDAGGGVVEGWLTHYCTYLAGVCDSLDTWFDEGSPEDADFGLPAPADVRADSTSGVDDDGRDDDDGWANEVAALIEILRERDDLEGLADLVSAAEDSLDAITVLRWKRSLARLDRSGRITVNAIDMFSDAVFDVRLLAGVQAHETRSQSPPGSALPWWLEPTEWAPDEDF